MNNSNDSGIIIRIDDDGDFVDLDNPQDSNQSDIQPQNQSPDYLLERKAHWKRKAYHYCDKLSKIEKKHEKTLARAKRRIMFWRKNFQEELKMKIWWRTASFIAGGICLIVIVSMLVVSQMFSVLNSRIEVPHVPASGKVPRTPEQVLSCVIIFNGEVQGSGVVISQGEKYATILSAAHNFRGEIGGKFWVYFADGTYTEATLLAHDSQRDLALARVNADTILARSYVPEEPPDENNFVLCGYPKGQGPNLRNTNYNGKFQNQYDKTMWSLDVNGTVEDGDSGDGLFKGAALCGLTSQRDAVTYTYYRQKRCLYKTQSRRMYAIAHQEIVEFLNENKNNLDECGDWSKPPELLVTNEKSPPLWKPSPNVPIFTAAKENNTLEPRINKLEQSFSTLEKRLNAPLPPSLLKRPSEILNGKKP